VDVRIRWAPGETETRERVSLPLLRRRLVEECFSVSVHSVRRVFGKKALITAIRQANPFRLPVSGGQFDVWFIDEPHRLPTRSERWSSIEAGTARLWFMCSGCRQRAAKLYYYVVSGMLSDLRCRYCHNLTYLSVNCSGNQWYCEIARPMRQLLREKAELLRKPQTPLNTERLARLQIRLGALQQKLRPAKRNRNNLKRTYRNIALIA